MRQVYQTEVCATDRFVCLTLAFHVNHKHPQTGCYPSVSRIAQETGYSLRTVQGALNRLELAGHITRKFKPGRRTIYMVHPRSLCGGNRKDGGVAPSATRAASAGAPAVSAGGTPAAVADEQEKSRIKKVGERSSQAAKRDRSGTSGSIGEQLHRSGLPVIRQAMHWVQKQ
jgi:hypothetical protein